MICSHAMIYPQAVFNSRDSTVFIPTVTGEKVISTKYFTFQNKYRKIGFGEMYLFAVISETIMIKFDLQANSIFNNLTLHCFNLLGRYWGPIILLEF